MHEPRRFAQVRQCDFRCNRRGEWALYGMCVVFLSGSRTVGCKCLYGIYVHESSFQKTSGSGAAGVGVGWSVCATGSRQVECAVLGGSFP